jgi:hypothetical protein
MLKVNYLSFTKHNDLIVSLCAGSVFSYSKVLTENMLNLPSFDPAQILKTNKLFTF